MTGARITDLPAISPERANGTEAFAIRCGKEWFAGYRGRDGCGHEAYVPKLRSHLAHALFIDSEKRAQHHVRCLEMQGCSGATIVLVGILGEES